MNYLDTAKDSAETVIHTVGTFVRKEKDPIEQAYITIFLMLVIAATMFMAGWAVGFGQGAMR